MEASRPSSRRQRGGGTHTDTHHAAVIDGLGRRLADAEFTTTATGYQALLDWLLSHGTPTGIGVEGTGSYGAGLTRVLTAAGLAVFDERGVDGAVAGVARAVRRAAKAALRPQTGQLYQYYLQSLTVLAGVVVLLLLVR